MTPASVRGRAALVVAVGLAVGALTSVGQTHLATPLHAFVNSASAWLLAPFFLGCGMRSFRGAAAAGLAACALQLVGYYATAELRGCPAGGAIVLFWVTCAIVGGPIFGVAGRLWQVGDRSKRGLGPATLATAFLAEGLWVYLHVLHDDSTAALWIGIGVLLVIVMTRGTRERRWLAATLPLGLAAEVLLGEIYRQSF
jgi:hypothetical protein